MQLNCCNRYKEARIPTTQTTCQMEHTVTEWGRGRLPSPEGVGWLVRSDIPEGVGWLVRKLSIEGLSPKQFCEKFRSGVK